MPNIKQLKDFTIAAIKHVVRGSPTCSQRQIDARLAICQACEHFRNNHCRKCGCKCRKRKMFLNKLAWADQSCPVGKWSTVKPQRVSESDSVEGQSETTRA